VGERHDRGEPDSGASQVPDLESVNESMNGAVNHAELAGFDEAPDLAMVHADDEFLDRLGAMNLRLDSDDFNDVNDFDADLDGFGDDRLSELLLSWRRDVESEPIGELVEPKLAAMTVQAARLRRRRRPRLLVPVAAAAAVLAISFAGMGLAARDAQPGDTLWALTKVLYADHARSVEAAEAVKADLREAKLALTEGDLAEAKSKLEDAHAQLPTVTPEDGKSDLEEQHASLVAQLPGNPSGEASPPPSANPTTAPNPGSPTGSGTTSPSPTNPPPVENTSPSTPLTTDETTPPTSETSRSEETPAGTEGEPAGTAAEPANVPQTGE
jgi:hypothetical protein